MMLPACRTKTHTRQVRLLDVLLSPKHLILQFCICASGQAAVRPELQSATLPGVRSTIFALAQHVCHLVALLMLNTVIPVCGALTLLLLLCCARLCPGLCRC